MSADPPARAGKKRICSSCRPIAACSGDMRSAIRALILANESREREVKELVSKGYGRGRFGAPDPLPRDQKDWYD